jgi:signal transduction histidine kinase/CheY-like chemotaxis protein
MPEPMSGADDVAAQQAALFIRQVPALVAANLVLVTFIGVNVAGFASAVVAGTWLAVAYGLAALRIGSLLRMHAQRRLGRAPSSRLLVVLSLLGGATWGAAGWLFFTPANPSNILLLGMAIAAVTAGSIASTAAVWPAYLSYSTASSLPFAIRALQEGGPLFSALGWLVLLFLLFNMIFARNVHRVICGAIQLSRRNTQLISSLQKENARAVDMAQAKSTFLAAASHELRQPTHALGLLIQALQNIAARPVAAPEHLDRVAQQMQCSLDGLTQLLSTLLDISKLDAGTIEPRMGPVSIGSVLETLEGEFASLAAARDLRLIVIPSDAWVWSDSVLLKLIVANFIANAIRYTARGGVLVAARRRGHAVEIQVYDTGIGIPDAERDSIFREFHQASNAIALGMNSAGVGLGLAVAARAADLIGARLKVRSRIGRGSMFSIEAEDTLKRERSKPPSSPRLAQEPRTILVLDDNQQVLAALELILSQWGHDVIPAHSPAEALDRIASHPRRPDLLISDLRLPDGDADIERLRKAAAAPGGALPPVLLVTGDTSRERILHARATGYEVLHKPVPPAQLAKAIEQLLGPCSRKSEIFPARSSK